MKFKFFKVIFITFLISLFLPITTSIAEEKEIILGEWLTAEKDSKVDIYKVGDRYFGKISWLKEPLKNGKPKVDDKNPDKNLQDRKLMGLLLLKDFKKTGENTWDDGKIYDPRNGKEYSCNMTLENPNQLKVRGYIGISLIGRTAIWTR